MLRFFSSKMTIFRLLFKKKHDYVDGYITKSNTFQRSRYRCNYFLEIIFKVKIFVDRNPIANNIGRIGITLTTKKLIFYAENPNRIEKFTFWT